MKYWRTMKYNLDAGNNDGGLICVFVFCHFNERVGRLIKCDWENNNKSYLFLEQRSTYHQVRY